MNVVAFGASNSSNSINKMLAHYTAAQIPDATVEVLDLNDFDVPMYSEDVEKKIGQAEGAKAFLDKLQQADAIVVAFAEHNGSYTAAYKNLFDWTSRIERNVFGNKPALFLATSPGPGGAKNVLAAAVASAGYFGADLKGSHSVPSFYDTFDVQSGAPIEADLEQQLKTLASTLSN
ncbi:NADPH-dependent FMN reductase [Vibrio sp. qd031]|uniref:NADPH-dependent FMN reductase n=1 Tax=Vibrio sp. qd031 TaxID=1603038 RepID=UPI000A106398|nr:NADPH-dependent FMN reductase [Vibrio sp. qd031]ORT49405.1 NADPH-dependent FMN reductase [Vibrio sp. qd031]